MKSYQFDKIYRLNETLSHWWKFTKLINIEMDHFEKKTFGWRIEFWWKSNALMKIPFFGEKSLKMIEIDRFVKIYHCDENSSSQIYHFGYLGSVYQCD